MSSPALQPEMTACFIPFLKTNPTKTGLNTPPTSPDAIEPQKRARPKLRLSKFLQTPGRESPTRCLVVSGREMNDPTPPNTSAKRTSKSPFRAVKEMKEPFPLILPDSPALTDDSEDEDRIQELRRISRSYSDLQTVANGHFYSRQNKPLLPSPMFLYGEKTKANSYLAYPCRNFDANDCEEPEDSYEVHRIISGYCKRERWSLLLEEVRRSKQMSQNTTNCSPVRSEDDSTSSSPPKRNRFRSCSAESDWLANTMSHDDRVQRFKQRCFQVVQHPQSREAHVNKNDENQIMLATVVVGPGKPKLVEIQRTFSHSTRRSSRTSQSETTSEGQPPVPKTPVRPRKEVSVFSPYDTPYQGTYGATTTAVNQDVVPPRRLRPAPLSLPPHGHKDKAIYLNSNRKASYASTIRDLEGPFNPSSTSSQGTLNATSTSTTTTKTFSTNPTRTSSLAYRPPIPTPTPTRTRSTWHLTRLLLALTHTIDSFPSHILRLDSPTITTYIRHSPSLPTSTYLAPLTAIFPTTSPLLLSALAAWLLIDAHLLSLESSLNSSLSGIEGRSNAPLHSIPAKARATLGINLPSREEMREWELRRRVSVVHVSVQVIAQRLMEAVRGEVGWDEQMWRALRVLVEMTDREGMGAKGEEEEGEWV